MRPATPHLTAAAVLAAGLSALTLAASCAPPIESELDSASLEMRQGAYEHAVSLYADVLRRVPDAPNIHNNMGYALAQLGRYDEAIVHYEAAAAQRGSGPLEATLLHNWAHALEKLGRLEESAAKYAEAAQADPARGDVYIGWGNVLVALGRVDDAAERYRQAVEASPESAVGWFNLGHAQERLDRADDALASYRTFLTLKGDVPSNIQEHARRFVAQADAARAGGQGGL
jgi:tetratricopeptide (TPR) repeat protein